MDLTREQYNKAVNLIARACTDVSMDASDIGVINEVVAEAAKQIPEKPVRSIAISEQGEFGHYIFRCVKCDTEITSERYLTRGSNLPRWCPKCGQRLMLNFDNSEVW